MATPKIILLLVIVGAGLWLVSTFLGTGIFALTTILYVALILALAQKMKVIKLLPISSKFETWAVIGVFAALFFTGGLAIFSPMLSPQGLMGGIPTGTVGGGAVTTPVVTQGACAALVSEEIRGTSATVTVNAYDRESNTPYSSTVNARTYIYKNGNFIRTDESNGASVTGFGVGDAISIYGGNSTTSANSVGAGFYYLDKVEGVCIDAQQDTVELNAHQHVSPSDVKITCYDETSSVELSAGTNTTGGQEDYDITIGADSDKTFYCKLEVDTANRAFNFKAISTIVENDIDDCYPTDGQGFTAVAVPKFLKNAVVRLDGGTVSNKTGWESYWEVPEPIMLSEWQFVKHKFILSSGSTDPSTNEAPTTSDICAITWLDATFNRGDDGLPHDGVVFTQDTAESNIGIQENITRPFNGASDTAIGVIIEGL